METITQQRLCNYNINNPYSLAVEGYSKLYVDYVPADQNRLGDYPLWRIVGIGFKTAPNDTCPHHGHKTFIIPDEKSTEKVLKAAFHWCLLKYAIRVDQWEKDPFGSYQLLGTLQKAINRQSTGPRIRREGADLMARSRNRHNMGYLVEQLNKCCDKYGGNCDTCPELFPCRFDFDARCSAGEVECPFCGETVVKNLYCSNCKAKLPTKAREIS